MTAPERPGADPSAHDPAGQGPAANDPAAQGPATQGPATYDPATHDPGAVVTRVDHVGIAVTDLEAAVAFHRDVLGLRVVHDEVNAEQGVREVLLRGVDGGAAVQLLAPLGADSPVGRFLRSRGPGLQQLALAVPDVDAAADELRRRGVDVLYPQGRPGTDGSRVNFVHPRDAGGVLVELVEAPRRTP